MVYLNTPYTTVWLRLPFSRKHIFLIILVGSTCVIPDHLLQHTHDINFQKIIFVYSLRIAAHTYFTYYWPIIIDNQNDKIRHDKGCMIIQDNDKIHDNTWNDNAW